MSPEQWREGQEADGTLQKVRGWLEAGRPPQWAEVLAEGPELKGYYGQWRSLELWDGLGVSAMAGARAGKRPPPTPRSPSAPSASLITKANLCLNSVKCSLFCQQTSFLGHVVSERGVSTDPAKVEAVEKWPAPMSST
ncbi:hypothetical protein AAFF_G00192860 [Aldrovandia affinis]|uniref:Uncharacterized protein n=1 Tax=Aldrovandia affinis TaxID=143900 RepID=A0AAD7RJF4_9TELE|nr:hypothetical protein AAFF_G00192860 [Aldrovandia affinis]